MAPTIVRWAFGYCAARGYQPPEARSNGLYVWISVAKPGQRGRCVVVDDRAENFISTIESVSDGDIYVEFAGSLAQHGLPLPIGWTVRDLAFLMTSPTPEPPVTLPTCAPGFTFKTTSSPRAIEAIAISVAGVQAARGVVGLDGDIAVYDQVTTEPEFRRNGLGTTIMHSLRSAAQTRGATDHLLIATKAGRSLYEQLGWTVDSEVTSVVSPASGA